MSRLPNAALSSSGSPAAARHHAEDRPLRHAERGARLGRVEHAQPPGRPRADVDEAASLAQSIRHRVHRAPDRIEAAVHGLHGVHVLLLDDAQHLRRRHAVEVRRLRVSHFSFKHIDSSFAFAFYGSAGIDYVVRRRRGERDAVACHGV